MASPVNRVAEKKLMSFLLLLLISGHCGFRMAGLLRSFIEWLGVWVKFYRFLHGCR